jgi:predicted secreted protein
MPVADVQSSAVVCAEEVGEDPAMDDLPGKVTVTVGDQAVVHLPSLAAAGYKWEAAADDPAIVETSLRFEDASPAGAGSPPAFGAHELLVLRGRTVGSTRVRCLQRRSWEAAEPSAEHTVTVDVVPADRKSTKKE